MAEPHLLNERGSNKDRNSNGEKEDIQKLNPITCTIVTSKFGGGSGSYRGLPSDSDQVQDFAPYDKGLNASYHMNEPLSSNPSSELANKLDLEFVQINEGFYDSQGSDVDLYFNQSPAMEGSFLDYDDGHRIMSGESDDKPPRENVIQRLSTLFPTRSQPKCHHQLTSCPENIRLSDNAEKAIDMASAIYSENAVTKEDSISYQGYTIRTEGTDLCINSVVFNSEEGNNFLRVVINTTEYEQFYRGTISTIKSQPRVLLDENKWTMLYGAYDDDSLGVVEIEVPAGVRVSEIQSSGPDQGLITIDLPRSPEFL